MAGAMICRPTGRLSSADSPEGTDIAQCPARLVGNVHRSERYMASGSPTFSPNFHGVNGLVGETSTSTFS